MSMKQSLCFAIGSALVLGLAATSSFAVDYDSCAKADFKREEWNELRSDARIAMRACYVDMLSRATPAILRILNEDVKVTAPLAAADIRCELLTGLGYISTVDPLRLGATVTQKMRATSGDYSADVKFSGTFYADEWAKSEIVMKGEVRDPLGNVITPGKKVRVTKRSMRGQMYFNIKNLGNGYVILDTASYSNYVLRRFGKPGQEIPNGLHTLECEQALPTLEEDVVSTP